MASTQEIPTNTRRIDPWKQKVPISNCKEQISKGEDLPYLTWKTVNRLRTGVGRCKLDTFEWTHYQKMTNAKVAPSGPCNVSWSVRTSRQRVTTRDLLEANDRAVEVAGYWREIVRRRLMARTRKIKINSLKHLDGRLATQPR